MIARGVVKKVGREGFIVPGEVHALPQNLNALKRSHASLLRFLKELKGLGIEAN